MKKINRYITVVALLLMTVMSPFSVFYSAFANEQDSGIQTIVQTDDLTVTVEPTMFQDTIHWELKYKQKAFSETNRATRVKIKLFSEGKLVTIGNQQGISQIEDNWFGESQFASNEGVIHFSTNTQERNLLLEVQQDQLIDDELNQSSTKKNILEKQYQGPFKLEIPKSIPIKKNEDLDKNKGIPMNDRSNQSQTVRLKPSNNRITYLDPFEYIRQEESYFPKNYTNQYLHGMSSLNLSADTIRNFNYGEDYQKDPQTLNSIGGDLNFANGYHSHQYSMNPDTKANSVLTKKTVLPTSDPNRFKIQLDVIGGVAETKKPIDVVFVLDKSTSMGQDIYGNNLANGPANYYSKWNVLKRALTTFGNGLTSSVNDIQMSVVGFGSTRVSNYPVVRRAIWAESAKFGSTPFTKDFNRLNNSPILLDDPMFNSGTPTYLGVDLGAKILTENGRPNANKYLIVLTDGEPTFYSRNGLGTSSAIKDDFANRVRYTLNENQFNGTGSTSYPYETNFYIKNNIYNKDVMKSVVKFGIGMGTGSSADVRSVLETIAEQPSRVLNADSNQELTASLETIKQTITAYESIFQEGTLTDPMSPYVSLIGEKSDVKVTALNLKNDTPSELKLIKEDSENFPEYAQKIKENAVINHNVDGEKTINLSQMNLGASDGYRHGIRLNYTVELKPEYRNGKFYPTNGPTSAVTENHETAYAFAVPSVRNATQHLTIEKIWEEDALFTDLRKEVRFQVQQSVEGSPWVNVEGQTLTIKAEAKGEDLKGTFSNLPTMSIHENEDGSFNYQPINYRVIETERVYGYMEPKIEPSGGINKDSTNRNVVIKNTLQTTRLDFKKVNEAGQLLKGAEFTLFRKLDSEFVEFQRVNDPKNSDFSFEKIPIGTYLLKETITPSGFQTKEEIEFTVNESLDGKLAIQVTKGSLDDRSEEEGNQLVNKLTPYSLSVIKQDEQTKERLPEVEFTLSEKVSGKVVSNLVTNEEGTGQFLDEQNQPINLEVGKSYLLKEIKASSGYVLDPVPLEITLKKEGTFSLLKSGSDYQNFTIKEKRIELTINNHQKGILPSTGGMGAKKYSQLALVCIFTLIIISTIYLYRNRKEVY